ncbi:MAG: phenylalanine--tRNA ligase subunit beta [Planctomycetota bacterium]|jgi:phenylalanyl-tRNA synthetase beta chain|nr:phenylalanine--tRNA ligase subunit beta [Planctomycetota bacterium]
MILSYNWLKELTGATLPPQELADALTRVGLNVEEVSPVGNGDYALNADITTNRPDWLCHLGVAHEIAAVLGLKVALPAVNLKETGPDVATLSSVTVMPGAETYCPRYTLRIIQGIKVGPSPAWLRDRLTSIGQRSINNIVDITNLVCFEMNQPLHAFDMDKLSGGRIVLRTARQGEEFDAITGEHATLEPDMLVIADAAKAVALAGVKGGQNTEVGDGTVNVLLESAWFQPRGVRRAARRTRMSSESSYRYERGIDPGMTARASARAASLILELAGGSLASGVIDTNPDLGAPWEVSMRFERCEKLLGVSIGREEARKVFKGLGLAEKQVDDAAIRVEVPSFRQDLRREADLIEEVIRLCGYDRIPEKITMPLALAHVMPETATVRDIRRVLVGLGYHECVTDSFVPREWAGAFAPGVESYTIQNPINAERPVMRATLSPSLLEVRRTNRLVDDVRLFEIGRVYLKNEGTPVEYTRLAILDDRGADFVRGALEAAVRALGLQGAVTVAPQETMAGMADGSGASMRLDGAEFAVLGVVAGDQTAHFDLPLAPAVGEAAVDFLAGAPRAGRRYQPLPRFPGVRRDISLSVPEEVLWGHMEEVARGSAEMLDSLAFESLYRGKGLKPGMKGMAFSMLLRSPDRSLTDAEANAVRDAVAKALLAAFPGSEMR